MEWTIDRPTPVHIQTDDDLRQLKQKLANCTIAAFDTETTGLHPTEDHILFWSLSTGPDRYFLEREHLEPMRGVLEDPHRTWIGTNTKYDAHMMANAGIDIKGTWHCTLTMDRMADCDQPHGLKDVYQREFRERVLEFTEVFGARDSRGVYKLPKNRSMQDTLLDVWDARPQHVIDYASLDAWMSFRIYEVLEARLQDMVTWRGQDMFSLYEELEVPFHRVLFKMERRGMMVDTGYLESLIPKIEERIHRLNRELTRVAGCFVNPNSPKQLIDLFFGQRGIVPQKFTSTGAPSVDKEVLDELAKWGVPEAKIVREVRAIRKTLSSLQKTILPKVCKDGRIHSTFNQHVADTCRLSSNEPNLQQLPNPEKDEWGIRRAFIAPPGYDYLGGDYDQVELYIAAHFSMDPALLAAIDQGQDLHAASAAFVWEESYDDILEAKKNKDADDERSVYLRGLRRDSKVISFGLLYGKGPNLLASELGYFETVKKKNPKLSDKEVSWKAKDMAIELTRQFFARMPKVEDFIAETHRVAADFKYVETWLGRRRWLRHVSDREYTEAHQREAEQAARAKNRDPRRALCWCDICRDSRAGQRQATNTPVQGTAADILQKALIQIDRDPDLSEVHAIIQAHDEGGFEVPKEIVHDASARIKWHLENPGIPDLRVPLRADLGAGPNWLEAK